MNTGCEVRPDPEQPQFRLTPDSIEGWFDRLNQQLDEVESDLERLNLDKIQRDITVLKRILKGGGI